MWVLQEYRFYLIIAVIALAGIIGLFFFMQSKQGYTDFTTELTSRYAQVQSIGTENNTLRDILTADGVNLLWTTGNNLFWLNLDGTADDILLIQATAMEDELPDSIAVGSYKISFVTRGILSSDSIRVGDMSSSDSLPDKGWGLFTEGVIIYSFSDANTANDIVSKYLPGAFVSGEQVFVPVVETTEARIQAQSMYSYYTTGEFLANTSGGSSGGPTGPVAPTTLGEGDMCNENPGCMCELSGESAKFIFNGVLCDSTNIPTSTTFIVSVPLESNYVQASMNVPTSHYRVIVDGKIYTVIGDTLYSYNVQTLEEEVVFTYNLPSNRIPQGLAVNEEGNEVCISITNGTSGVNTSYNINCYDLIGNLQGTYVTGTTAPRISSFNNNYIITIDNTPKIDVINRSTGVRQNISTGTPWNTASAYVTEDNLLYVAGSTSYIRDLTTGINTPVAAPMALPWTPMQRVGNTLRYAIGSVSGVQGVAEWDMDTNIVTTLVSNISNQTTTAYKHILKEGYYVHSSGNQLYIYNLEGTLLQNLRISPSSEFFIINNRLAYFAGDSLIVITDFLNPVADPANPIQVADIVNVNNIDYITMNIANSNLSNVSTNMELIEVKTINLDSTMMMDMGWEIMFLPSTALNTFAPSVGDILTFTFFNGDTHTTTVTSVSPDSLGLDNNGPLGMGGASRMSSYNESNKISIPVEALTGNTSIEVGSLLTPNLDGTSSHVLGYRLTTPSDFNTNQLVIEEVQ